VITQQGSRVKASTVATGLGASVLVIGVAATGCGSTKSSSPSSTTSSSASTSSAPPSSAAPTSSSGAAQPSDYSNLLIKPTDIVVPGDTFTLASPKPSDNPAGVIGTFASASTDANGPTREIDVIIHVYPDAGKATEEHDQVAPNVANPQLGFTLVGGTATPADVGTGGAMAIGTNSDAAKQRARVVFSEGRAFVQIEFFNPGNDPFKPDFVLDIARKQDAAVKAGLPA
jgi:hypothetical protein